MFAVASPQTRRKRGKPSTKVRNCIIDRADEEILLHVYYNRGLRTSHLQALTGRPYEGLKNRLRKLRDGRLLGCGIDPRKEGRGGNPELIHALGNDGLTYVCDYLEIDRPAVDMTDANHTYEQVPHLMLTSDFMVRILLACRANPHIRLMYQDEILQRAPKTWDVDQLPTLRAPVPDRGTTTSEATKPDKFFALENSKLPAPRNRFYFFLEADRSNMTQRATKRDPDRRTILKKMQVYYHWRDQGGPKADFDIKAFRVLWLTAKSELRFRNMISHNKTIHDGGWPNFLFAYRDNLFGAPSFFDANWIDGRGETKTLL